MKKDKGEEALVEYVKNRYSKQTDYILTEFAKYLQSNYNMTLQIGVWRHFDSNEVHRIEQVIDCYRREQKLL